MFRLIVLVLLVFNRVPYWLGLKRGAFTCVGWQVTLCDPIWQVTSRSCEMEYPLTAVRSFVFFYSQCEATGNGREDSSVELRPCAQRRHVYMVAAVRTLGLALSDRRPVVSVRPAVLQPQFRVVEIQQPGVELQRRTAARSLLPLQHQRRVESAGSGS